MVLTRSLKRELEGEHNTDRPPTKKTKDSGEKETEETEKITITGNKTGNKTKETDDEKAERYVEEDELLETALNHHIMESDDSDDDEIDIENGVSLEFDDEGELSVDYQDLVRMIGETDPEIAENLEKVIATIHEKTPNFMKLLQENVGHEHRVKLIEMYEAMKELEAAGMAGHPSKLEYLALRDHINALVKKYKQKKIVQDQLSVSMVEALKKTKDEMELEMPQDETIEQRILSLETSTSNRLAIYNKYKELEKLSPDDHERSKLTTWLNWATGMPHDKIKNLDIMYENIPATLQKIAERLDEELYGMIEVKEQILTFINARLINPHVRGCSLGLIGPPGTGKTTIARLLATVLDTPFSQMSFGGVRDADFLKGHDYCYVGSRPGEIVRCLTSMKYKNGILFMDEFEKIADNKGITSCLLHIVDPQQNHEFQDSYLREIKVDLSHLWFVYSMNGEPTDSALNDRLYKIKVPGYQKQEKQEIIRKYSMRKILKNAGLNHGDITMSEEVAAFFVEKVSPGVSGIRELEQGLSNVVNKISFLVNNGVKCAKFPFKISFRLKSSEELNYPVTLTKEIIDVFFKKKGYDRTSFNAMYL